MYLHREYVRGVQHNMNRNNVDYLLEEFHHALQMSERKQALKQKFLRDELSWVSNLDKTELSSWVRVETDRSSVHFSPVSTISTCIDDTERYCLPDDVIKFVRPVPSLEGLLSVSLALMKVPPLPLSHSAYILCFLGTADNTGDDAELLATGHFSLLSHLGKVLLLLWWISPMT
ncbi:uncharacterized protein LOC113469710 [Diaphorina citri]|uniref:Uncharacterized protein LOC113469710 n=1 Tax=Diaphorina citri TaxID=121845 RepID=A0A3Q0J8U3_DIACI|nr:uncharacterized protein LOC113469710 [Diaphorina citri]